MTWRRILLAGLALSALVGLAGSGAERLRLGATDDAAARRVESEARSSVATMAAELDRLVAALAPNRSQIDAASRGPSTARLLFDLARSALPEARTTDLAVSIYSPGGLALAWEGRPAEVSRDRLPQRALFVAPGPLGPRLVRVEPVMGDDGRNVGTVVAERVLSAGPGVRNPLTDVFRLDTSLAPVSLRARDESAGDTRGAHTFHINSPAGELLLEATVSPDDVAAVRRRWRQAVRGLALGVLAIAIALASATTLRTGEPAPARRAPWPHSLGLVAGIASARILLGIAVPGGWETPAAFSRSVYGWDAAGLLLKSPADFLLTALAGLAIAAVAARALERRRLGRPQPWGWPRAGRAWRIGGLHLAAGSCVALLVVSYQVFLAHTVSSAGTDILHLSLHPWNSARLAMTAGLVLFHAGVVWTATVLFRSVVRHSRAQLRRIAVRAGVLTAWMLPTAIVLGVARARGWVVPEVQALLVVAACGLAAFLGRRAAGRLRHASQSARLAALFLALFLPSVVLYPSMQHAADRAKRHLVETEYAPQAAAHGEQLQAHLNRSLTQVDRIPALAELVAPGSLPARLDPGADRTFPAFLIWAQTDLATYRLTSAVELYGSDGMLVSRFALNLPEYTAVPQQWAEASCAWEVFGEASRFGSEDRRILHAGRGLCAAGSGGPRGSSPSMSGAIVVHVMLDYSTLPFISSQNPYVELLRPHEGARREGLPGRDVELVIYGWGGSALFSSGTTIRALDQDLFTRVARSRRPFWTSLDSGGRRDEVYLTNDRSGIYALTYPGMTLFDHLVNVTAIAILAGVLYALGLLAHTLQAMLTRGRPTSGRALLHEVRASFYRKLFLAFVAASVVPVITLSLVIRAYFTGQLRRNVESEAGKVAAVAQRVIEDYATSQQLGDGRLPALDDDIMVGVSRVIGQDANVFDGSRLVATSERDLFASGLLPTRTPSSVYVAIALLRLPAFVGYDRLGAFEYIIAATPLRTGQRDHILTVPLTLRQQEIEQEIDELDRGIQLAALGFILIGALLGYSMAERIADPVNRLTRAARRIAQGDLDARIIAASADELQRLVDAFNNMAADLKRQRHQLERTQRLEAWAEMARQVAHEIKNPLTPIQLAAEHLRRVHADRGHPLGGVLEGCIDSILEQVRLLRQIAGEFSSFATAPTARPARTHLSDLVADALDPYRRGLETRVAVAVDVPRSLPHLVIDRTLVSRALVNVIENALDAMPGQGRLTIRASANSECLRLTVADTGAGMDEEAAQRAFEPYFSTKTTGTGLGLAIARRNIELNGGTIEVASEKGKGATVTITFPLTADAKS